MTKALHCSHTNLYSQLGISKTGYHKKNMHIAHLYSKIKKALVTPAILLQFQNGICYISL